MGIIWNKNIFFHPYFLFLLQLGQKTLSLCAFSVNCEKWQCSGVFPHTFSLSLFASEFTGFLTMFRNPEYFLVYCGFTDLEVPTFIPCKCKTKEHKLGKKHFFSSNLQVHRKIREDSDMAQDSLQCLAQLASMHGPVFPDESAQVSYLAHLVEGLLSMING